MKTVIEKLKNLDPESKEFYENLNIALENIDDLEPEEFELVLTKIEEDREREIEQEIERKKRQ